jgi:hypothetical protein
MLDFDYSDRLESLIQSLGWQIELPADWSNYFNETGDYGTYANDQRQNRRVKVRTLAVLHYERQLPSVPREPALVGVYTRDFSRRGCGFLCPHQIYPQETVRLILPTFWIRLEIMRARRIGPSCFEIGGELLEQNSPSVDAFDGIQVPTLTGV